MIKDRGMKKWHGFMMSEHTDMLGERDWDMHKTNKPELDEYQLQEIDEKLKVAMEYKFPMIFTLWIDGLEEDHEGVVQKIDDINKMIYVNEITGDLKKVDYQSIINVDFTE